MSSSEEEDTDIVEAAKKGDVDLIQYALSSEGPSVLKQRGKKGETALHWGAFLGRIDIVRLLVDSGAPVASPCDNEFGQHPIHWACTSGQVHIMDYLLKHGVDIEQRDKESFTPLLIACQNNQPTAVLFLMGRGANINVVDKDGSTALHWAAYKAKSDVVQLLLNREVDAHAIDGIGQNPLHLACLSGNVGVAKLLLDEGVDRHKVDKNGNTPVKLAELHKHYDVVEIVSDARRSPLQLLKYFTPYGFFFGAPGEHKCQLKLFLGEAFLLGYPVYLYKIAPVTFSDCLYAHFFFWFFHIVMWVCFFKVRYVDPGFLPCNTKEYSDALEELSTRSDFSDVRTQKISSGQMALTLPDFCHSCRLIKAPRSKHCKFCRRCVFLHDHHCPYLDQCVAYNNRISFFFFTWSVNFIGILAIYFLINVWTIEGFSWFLLFLLINTIFLELMVLVLVVGHVILITGNTTTYECASMSSLPAFHNAFGKIKNPYNRGIMDNVREYFHLIPPTVSIDFGQRTAEVI